MNLESKAIVSRLIRNEFHRLRNDWINGSESDLIATAKDLGLDELAEEMQNDLL